MTTDHINFLFMLIMFLGRDNMLGRACAKGGHALKSRARIYLVFTGIYFMTFRQILYMSELKQNLHYCLKFKV